MVPGSARNWIAVNAVQQSNPKQKLKTENMTTPQLKNSIGRSPLWLCFFLITLALACFALSPTAQAVSPAPDGGYPNANTAEGEDALFSLTSGIQNTALGSRALYSDTTGDNNTAVGRDALLINTTGTYNTATGVAALASNTTGNSNTAIGLNAMVANTTGHENTATGDAALASNTTGIDNTATGVQALGYMTAGDGNTATGRAALYSNTADANTATGTQALYSNTTGFENDAHGFQALYSNTTGGANTATGFQALHSNTADANTATGDQALYSNTTGHRNTAIGGAALPANTTGFRNTGAGFASLFNNSTGKLNTATGWSSLFNNSTGSFNIALGYKAGALTTGDNNIDVGNLGGAGEANTIRIGNQVAGTDDVGFPHPPHTATYIAGIYGTTVAKSAAVFIDSNGHLGTKSSSERFKDEIKPMDNASKAILALKPVSFRYKKEIDPDRTPQFGLVAEDVAKVNPDLVVCDEQGRVYTVRYEAVNAMLLNEFLKEHRKNEEQEATITRLIATDMRQQKQLEALTATLQRVSAQLELSKPEPQTVLNNR
jgi:hypothetical protein